jgi:hypothetical protein
MKSQTLLDLIGSDKVELKLRGIALDQRWIETRLTAQEQHSLTAGIKQRGLRFRTPKQSARTFFPNQNLPGLFL